MIKYNFNKTIGIIIALTLYFSSYGQTPDKKIIIEQFALDYFADSIISKRKPLINKIAHFNGQVDSSITAIGSTFAYMYPDNNELQRLWGIRENADNDFWENNKKGTFELKVKTPIQTKIKKKYNRKSNVARLIIFQNKKVGNKNYVQFKLHIGTGDQGHNLYFVLNEEGKVIKWTYNTFIY